MSPYISLGSRLDRERWQEDKHHRPPHTANPVDADSKACICRYTYDVNELHVSCMEASLLSSLIVYAKQLHQPVMCFVQLPALRHHPPTAPEVIPMLNITICKSYTLPKSEKGSTPLVRGPVAPKIAIY